MRSFSADHDRQRFGGGHFGHWAIDVLDAGDSTNGRLTANRLASMDTVQAVDIVFEYNAFVDAGNNGGAVRLNSLATVSLSSPATTRRPARDPSRSERQHHQLDRR